MENKIIIEEELAADLTRAYSALRSAMNALHKIANVIDLNLKQSSVTYKANQDSKWQNNQSKI